MSKQQGQSPEENQVPKKSGRKRKGKYELWMRHNPKFRNNYPVALEWFKVRTYATMELAELNLKEQFRKWNSWYPEGQKDTWEFEIRVKE